MSTKSITGIIPIEEENIAFSSIENSFEFSLISNSSFKLPYGQKIIKMTPTDGFICGKTHDAHEIAIYIGNSEFIFSGAASVRTSAYIKSMYNSIDIDITEYDSIQFVGGTLNEVFHINGMKIEDEDDRYIIEKNDDTLIYNIKTEKYCMEMKLCSEIRALTSIHGSSIKNTDAILTLAFDKTMSIYSLFEHYNNMKDLLSLLTFRKNVGFDKIYLVKKIEKVGTIKVSEVFVRPDGELTNKSRLHNICFEDILDAVPNLVKLLYDKKDEAAGISLGFLPTNDKDLNLMTNTKIRAICSALETELYFVGYEEDDNELDELIEELKKTAKSFKKAHPTLSNDVYSRFVNNLAKSHPPLKKRLCVLHNEYREEINIMNTSNFIVGDKAIGEFVDYRNSITHGRHRIMDIKTATIAYYMSGLVYCCLLARIGVERSKIKELCEMKILR